MVIFHTYVSLPRGEYCTLFIWLLGPWGWAGRGLRVCERCLRDESLGPAAEGAERALFFVVCEAPKKQKIQGIQRVLTKKMGM